MGPCLTDATRPGRIPPSIRTSREPATCAAPCKPKLHALLPVTSHEVLGFSSTVGYPHSGDHPWVEPLAVNRYLVRAANGHKLGTADAAGSLALVLAALDGQIGGRS